jgi:DNA helicase-2/ATP-dependent DNA helicase PcrA
VIEEAFVRYGLPYKLVAGTRFYERREIKDVIAYLRLVQNPYDSVSLIRVINVPGRGIGQTTLDQLSAWAKSEGVTQYEALQKLADPACNAASLPFNSRIAKSLAAFGGLLGELIAASREMSLTDFFDRLTIRSGYKDYLLNEEGGDERWDNVMELRTVAESYKDMGAQEGLNAFLEGVALVSDVDALKQTEDKVTLITLHQAKGLEFGVVFIAGVEEGLLPHFRTFDDPIQLEEERRLCYVGITRAKNRIYLVHAFRRNLMGRSTVNKPSRFLQDIPRRLITGSEVWQAAESRIGSEYNRQESRPALTANQAPLPELKAGDHVRHAIFGEGVVVSCTAKTGDSEVAVAFTGAGVKKLLLSFAKLEKV